MQRWLTFQNLFEARIFDRFAKMDVVRKCVCFDNDRVFY